MVNACKARENFIFPVRLFHHVYLAIMDSTSSLSIYTKTCLERLQVWDHFLEPPPTILNVTGGRFYIVHFSATEPCPFCQQTFSRNQFLWSMGLSKLQDRFYCKSEIQSKHFVLQNSNRKCFK